MPTEVGAVEHGAGARVDIPGRADADPDNAFGILVGRADHRVERADDGLETQIFKVFFMLTVDETVFRHDGGGHVGTAEIDANGRSHGRYG